MRRAYAAMSGQLSPSGVFKELLASRAKTARSRRGGGGGQWWRKPEWGGEKRRRRNYPTHSANRAQMTKLGCLSTGGASGRDAEIQHLQSLLQHQKHSLPLHTEG